MKIKNIAIVGGSGAVGMVQSWILAAAGHTVTIVSSRTQGSQRLVQLQKHGGITFHCPEFDDIAQSLPETGLSRDSFVKKFVGIKPVQLRMEKYLDQEGFTSDELISKVQLEQLIREAMKIPIGPHLNVANHVKNIEIPQDYIAVTVKATGLTKLLAQHINTIPQLPNTPVATFVNGLMPWFRPEPDFGGMRLPALHNQYEYVETLGLNRSMGGIIIKYGAVADAPGLSRVKTPVQNARTVIGPVASVEITPQLLKIKDLYESAGLSVLLPVSDRGIAQIMFEKLALNMLNSPAAIFGRNIGELLDDSLTREVVVNAVNELYEIAKTQAVYLANSRDSFIKDLLSKLENVRPLIPSTLQDIEAGRPTEKDAILRAVIDLGKKTGVHTSYLERIYELLAEIEHQALVDRTQVQPFRDKVLALLSQAAKSSKHPFLAANFTVRSIF
ncbi:MAG: hypothetical protein F6K41_09845 [Symploca sp. SIO3E6]|nr:hypothetical protein [Caldora sp. SIO3E6]